MFFFAVFAILYLLRIESRAILQREPCQVRKEAAISASQYVPRERSVRSIYFAWKTIMAFAGGFAGPARQGNHAQRDKTGAFSFGCPKENQKGQRLGQLVRLQRKVLVLPAGRWAAQDAPAKAMLRIGTFRPHGAGWLMLFWLRALTLRARDVAFCSVPSAGREGAYKIFHMTRSSPRA